MRSVLIAFLLAVLIPAPAVAYDAPGPRWPGHTIRYHETFSPRWDWSLQRAVRTWNISGVRIRFREVPRSRAQVVVGFGSTGGNAGMATIGRSSGAFLRIEPLLYRPLRARDRISAAVVLAHELGHVIGLDHPRQRPCRLMSPRPLTYCPDPPQRWQYYCRWLAPDDLRGALALYGGRDRRRASPWCPLEPRPPALEVVFGPQDLTWRRVSVTPGTRVQIRTFTAGRCVGDPTAPLLAEVTRPVSTRSWRPASPGPLCVEVGLLGSRGRPGPVARGEITVGP